MPVPPPQVGYNERRVKETGSSWLRLAGRLKCSADLVPTVVISLYLGVALRSLIQVVLGMLGFVILISLASAIGNGSVVIAGSHVGGPVLGFAFIVDVAAMVTVSLYRAPERRTRDGDDFTPRT